MAMQTPIEDTVLPILPEDVTVGFCTLQTNDTSIQKTGEISTMENIEMTSYNALHQPNCLKFLRQFNDTVTIYDDEKQTILSFLNYIREGAQQAQWCDANQRELHHSTSTLKSSKHTLNNGKRKINDEKNDELKTMKKEKRNYCICDGDSHGDMIACDNRHCHDRSNWYHMSCVNLNTTPDTWLCPSCTLNFNDTSSSMPENLYRKPALSITYGDMITAALKETKHGQGTFKEICEYIEKKYENQLNWKLESDQRKSPVWKSSVRKILFSNNRFTRHATLKGVFCLVIT